METVNKKAIKGEAASAGLVLGLISSSYLIISNLRISGVVWGVFSFVLWAVKFVGCIWLMSYFMKKLCKNYEGVTNSDTFRLGVLIALFSALITAVVSYISAAYIFPDALEESMNKAMEMYSSFLDSNSMDQIEEMMDKLPAISLVSNFLWCMIFGTVLSAILSGRIPEKDPFASYKKDSDDQQ